MDKIELVVLGLSASPASNNAYALILKEADGNRRLPIIIGAFEAQAIALEMEGVEPPRPMTHDLLKSMMESFGAYLNEVFINDLQDGTFYAKLIFDSMGIELDARPSDAVALAVRCNAPIFVSSYIMDETGLAPEGDEADTAEEPMPFQTTAPKAEPEPEKPKSKVEMLQKQLDKAIAEEDYEKAASLRDQLKKLLESS